MYASSKESNETAHHCADLQVHLGFTSFMCWPISVPKINFYTKTWQDLYVAETLFYALTRPPDKSA